MRASAGCEASRPREAGGSRARFVLSRQEVTRELGARMRTEVPGRRRPRVSESERAAPERFDPATMNGLIAAEHLARYWLAADLASGLEVLDAGCGVGYGARDDRPGRGVARGRHRPGAGGDSRGLRKGGRGGRLSGRRRAGSALRRGIVRSRGLLRGARAPGGSGAGDHRAEGRSARGRPADRLLAQPRRLPAREPAPPSRVHARGAAGRTHGSVRQRRLDAPASLARVADR